MRKVLGWAGEFQNKQVIYTIVILVPLVLAVALSVPQLARVPQRLDDGDYSARLIEGNGTSLIWAPSGPGWPADIIVCHGGVFEKTKSVSQDSTGFGAVKDVE